MDNDVREKFRRLPALGGQSMPALACKICSAPAAAFDIVDFNKLCSVAQPYHFGLAGIPIVYHRCADCGFLFTAFFDDWSEQDFAEFIYNDDYIKVDGDYVERRPRTDAGMVAALLADHRGLSILDYGSGTGILAETLRDAGFDAESFDPFSSPQRPQRRFDLITCFEVIEHSPDPVATLRDLGGMLNETGCVLLGTGLQPAEILDVRAGWWYVGPRNGHVSIHTARSLELLGASAGLRLVQGAGPSAFVTADPSPDTCAIVASLGTPTFALTLSAPAPTPRTVTPVPDEQPWHGIEGTTLRFRWSQLEKIGWTWLSPTSGPAIIDLTVPLVLEVEPGFAARSRLLVNDIEHPLTRQGDALVASLLLDLNGPLRIILQTPPPLSPADLRGAADTRQLGLAIVAA